MANSAERGGADAHQQVEVVGALARAESLNHRFLFLFLYRPAGVWKGMCMHTCILLLI